MLDERYLQEALAREQALSTELVKEVHALRARCAALEEALEPFLDDNPCRYDHHGYCQEHQGVDEDGVCIVAKAAALLEQGE